MELEGEVISIIYKNDVNSYTIAEFETEDDMLTIVGYLPFISIGDSLKIIGKFVEHKSYGRQFKIDTFEKLMPKTLGALERYLANGNIKGVGEKLAKRIINKFGDDTISVLRDTPLRLAEIRGISESRAKEISESFIEKWEVWQIVGFLDRFGIFAPLLFIIIQIVQVVIPLIPCSISTGVGVVIFGPLWGFVYNYVGIVIGSIIVFFISRRYGMPLIKKMFKKELIDKYIGWLNSGKKFERFFAAAIFFPVAPDDFLCYLAGVTDISVKKYIAIIIFLKPFTIFLYSLGLVAIWDILMKIF